MNTAIICRSASPQTTTAFFKITGDAFSDVDSVSVSSSSVTVLAAVPARDVADDQTPLEFGDIQSLVDDWNQDPAMATHMAEARTWAGEYLFQGRVPTLKALRMKKGMSQAIFAGTLGTSQAHVSRLEAGQVDARASTLVRIAQVLDMDIETVAVAVCAGVSRSSDSHE